MRNSLERAVVALGMFDGMHIGHEALVRRAAALGGARSCKSVVCSFENHPLSVLGGEPRLLTDPAERRARMLACGADEVVLEAFTPALAALSPEAFIGRLCGRWAVSAVVIGFNYSFGAGGAGGGETLRALGAARGFDTEVLAPILVDGAPVSSSRIRALIEAGDTLAAQRLLGRPYRLSGEVTRNLGNGTRLGFPTANLEPEPWRVLPSAGVYATRAAADGVFYAAVTNVGNNPTLGGKKLTVETHLLDYAGGALYGTPLAVDFFEQLRTERAFPSLEALKAQIADDAARARALLCGRKC